MDQALKKYASFVDSALPFPNTANNAITVDPISEDDKEGRLAARSVIDNYENSLKEFLGSHRGDMDQINDDGLVEWFIPGVYIRELFIPKDTTIVGKIWKRPRMWIIAQGEVTFRTEMGMKRVVGPYRQIVAPGSKTALYAHEDTLWFAICATEVTSSDEVEGDVTVNDYSELIYPWSEVT